MLAVVSMHLVLLALFWVETKPLDWVVFAVLYFRVFFITAGYHRYFAHRAFKTSRWFQFILALGATSSAQRGVLWWAGHHRHHHRFSDQEEDVHSPIKGFIWSHVGWTTDARFTATRYDYVKDFMKFPELVWLNKHPYVVWGSLALLTYLIGGLSTLLVGFVLSTVVISHVTFCINSLAHVFGKRRYATSDTSKNNFLLGLFGFGEGWHNNHHHYQSSARNGFLWWEVDFSYYILRVLSWFGLVWDLREVPQRVLERNLLGVGAVDEGELVAAQKRQEYLGRRSPLWSIGAYAAHALVFLGSITMLVVSVVLGALHSPAPVIVGASLFGSFLLLYFAVKILLYYFPLKNLEGWGKKMKLFWKGLGHFNAVSLFLLVAAAYTPIVLALPSLAWGWSLFGLLWGLAAFALLYRVLARRFGVVFYGIAGVLLLTALVLSMVQVRIVFSSSALALLFVGVFCFALYYYIRPALPVYRVQGLGHLVLLLGSLSHFLFLAGYVLV